MVSKKTTAQSKPSSVGRPLFKNQAYDVLRARLDQFAYPPGTFLSERQLAEELGMSKTPVKAALERLELEGFITVSPQSGIVVRELQIDELHEMYQLRLAIEGFVLKSLAGKLSLQQCQLWQRNLGEYARLGELTGASSHSDALFQAVQLDAEFHLLPSRFLGNRLIETTMQQLSSKMLQVIHRVFSYLPTRVRQSHCEHVEIVQAVERGWGDHARQLCERHLSVGHDMLIEAVSRM